MEQTEQGWIDKFIRHLSHERRLATLTCTHYRRDLDALAAWCADEGLGHWRDLDEEHIRAYAARQYRRGISPRSIQRHLSAARSFFRFLLREKHVKQNPVASVSAPKAGKRLPANLDADRMARLLDIRDEGPLVDRDRAMMELLYSSGLRLAELVSLNCGDIDLADGMVAVTGKGGKDRVVPVGKAARKALAVWFKSRQQLLRGDEPAVFLSQRGTRLAHRSVQARVDYWARRQGIDSRVYPHLFRHSFASHILESSHDLRGVQELLGHANIGTTQVYTHLDFQHLAQIYDQTHPRARLKRKK